MEVPEPDRGYITWQWLSSAYKPVSPDPTEHISTEPRTIHDTDQPVSKHTHHAY